VGSYHSFILSLTVLYIRSSLGVGEGIDYCTDLCHLWLSPFPNWSLYL